MIKFKFLVLSLLLVPQLAMSYLVEDIVITGKIIKVEANKIHLKDKYGQKHLVDRKMLVEGTNGKKMQIGKMVSFKDKIKMRRPAPDFRLAPGIKLSKKDKTELVHAFYKFLVIADEKMAKKYPNYSPGEGDLLNGEETTFFQLKDMLNFFLPELIADQNVRCIYAGWPSRQVDDGSECRRPWSRTGTDSNYRACGGGDEVFRCNPKIFGTGIRSSTRSFNPSRAVEPYEGSGVRVFPTPDPANGLCIHRTETAEYSSIVRNCALAARRNMQSILSQPDFERYYEVTYLPIINTQCRHTNFCPGGFSKEGSECVLTCSEGNPTEVAGKRYCGTAPTEAEVSEQGEECAYLAEHIQSINFHRAGGRTQCTVISNQDYTAPGGVEVSASCKSVQLACQRNGHMVVGYLDQPGYTALKDSRMAEDPLSLNSSISLPTGTDVYTTACGDDTNSALAPVLTDGCNTLQPGQIHNLEEGRAVENSIRGGERCESDYCVVSAQCSVTRDGNASPFLTDVTAVCDCTSQERTATEGNASLTVSECLSREIPQMTPSNNSAPSSNQAPAEASGT